MSGRIPAGDVPGTGGAPARQPVLPPPLHAGNEALAFVLELIMLAALAWWGADTGSGLAEHVLLAIGAPLLAVIAWGLFAAPRARIRVPLAGVLAVKVVAFGAGTAAIYALGHHGLAIAFAVVAGVNTAIATVDRNAAKHHPTSHR